MGGFYSLGRTWCGQGKSTNVPRITQEKENRDSEFEATWGGIKDGIGT